LHDMRYHDIDSITITVSKIRGPVKKKMRMVGFQLRLPRGVLQRHPLPLDSARNPGWREVHLSRMNQK